ncbi:hypothetical protein [Bacillus vallismortis]|uniref:hypothetical protein n=1 Tax=Bacillus vallismortis TaxID=72361 RepID=UPI00227E09C6|nr:hypothetical protein [Bacillus vallismortis]MCY8598978.1 hypothetical protein [Bacillus vallismortis]MEC1268965.1 hypothetical protein [Bacillus vallismortis]
MKIESIVSSEKKPCAVCNRKTYSYKIYEQSNLTIEIPACDTESRNCLQKIDVKDMVAFAIKVIKKDIQEDAQ